MFTFDLFAFNLLLHIRLWIYPSISLWYTVQSHFFRKWCSLWYFADSTIKIRASLVPSIMVTLQWRHNGRDSVSNHQPHDCLLKCLCRRRSKKTSKLRVTGLCVGIHRTNGQLRGKCFHLMTSSWELQISGSQQVIGETPSYFNQSKCSSIYTHGIHFVSILVIRT